MSSTLNINKNYPVSPETLGSENVSTIITTQKSAAVPVLPLLPVLAPLIPSKTATNTVFSNPHWDTQQQVLSFDIVLPDTFTTVIISSWQQGVDVWMRVNGELERYDPPFAPSLLPIEFFSTPLLQDWVATIPPEIMTRLECFALNPLGFLHIINCYPVAYDLFISHPVLFTLLYQHTQYYRKGLSWLVEQCQRKRALILQSCGLPGTPSAVKMLKKIHCQRLSARQIALLHKLFTLNYSVLNHLASVTDSMLRGIIRQPLLLESRLLRHWQEETAETLLNTLEDIQRLRRHRFLAPHRLIQGVKNCRNLADVTRLHDRLVDLVNQHEPDRVWGNTVFPAPPLPGNSVIIPLTTYAELRTEGRQQHHCVVSFADEIISGDYYVYQVLAPERATLGLTLRWTATPPSGWLISIDQLHGVNNAPVKAETWASVETWLAAAHSAKGA